MNANDFITWATPLLLLAMGLYLKSYLGEKAKNLATGEDIKGLTISVEEVKVEFTKEVEHLKTTLEIQSQTRLGILDLERNAIIDYVKSYFRWSNSMLDVPNTHKLDEVEEIYEKSIFLQRAVEDAATNFDLFIGECDLTLSRLNLLNETLTKQASAYRSGVQGIKLSCVDIETLTSEEGYDRAEAKRLVSVHAEISKAAVVATSDACRGKLEELQTVFLRDCKKHIHQNIS